MVVSSQACLMVCHSIKVHQHCTQATCHIQHRQESFAASCHQKTWPWTSCHGKQYICCLSAPTGLCTDAADDDDADDSVVMVDDDDDMDDGETVMVDALEALRIHQPHIAQPDRLSQLTMAAEAAADRPQTAKGGSR